jgi:hypothetical protein
MSVQNGFCWALAICTSVFAQSLATAAAEQAERAPAWMGSEAVVANLGPEPARGLERAGNEPAIRGNPLWSLPLGSLSATRDRPLFSPSRRPVPTPVVAAPYVPPPAPPPPPPREPDPPPVTLVGTLTGDGQGIAIFIKPNDKTPLRLRIGEDTEGWVLRAVRRREVIFESNGRTATLSLPIPEPPLMMDGDGNVIAPKGGARPTTNRASPRNAGPITVQ